MAYGPALINVRVPEDLAELEGELPDGGRRYRVEVSGLRPEHIVRRVEIGSNMCASRPRPAWAVRSVPLHGARELGGPRGVCDHTRVGVPQLTPPQPPTGAGCAARPSAT